jgi:hypothetical protein
MGTALAAARRAPYGRASPPGEASTPSAPSVGTIGAA